MTGHEPQPNGQPAECGRLHTDEQIRAAGAAAVEGWQLTDDQIDQLVVLIGTERAPAADTDAA